MTSEREFGLLPRFVRHLFNSLDHEVRVKVSYMEVDNEDVRDLLSDGQGRSVVPQQIGDQLELEGLSEIECDSVSDVMSCFVSGQAVRSIKGVETFGLSSNNQLHGIFSLNVVQVNKASNVLKRSTVRFVDLAPSNQVYSSQSTVNLGLLALNNVVSALGDPRRNVSCVPYEDALLSRLLKNALGGHSLTLAVCCISPAENDAEETLNTLMYARRMSNIRNNPTPRVESLISADDIEVTQVTEQMTTDDQIQKDLRSVSSNLGRMPAFNQTSVNSLDECSLPNFSLTDQQAILLQKIEEEKLKILAMHARQQELLQNGLLFPPFNHLQQIQMQQQMQHHQMLYLQQRNNDLNTMLNRPEQALSPFIPITQRSTPIETSPLSHKSPLAVQMYLDQEPSPKNEEKPDNDVIVPVNLSTPINTDNSPQKSSKERKQSINANQQSKLASIVEESEHDLTTSTSGTFSSKNIKSSEFEISDSDEFDSEDEDEFNSEASIVSTDVIENHDAKVNDIIEEFKKANFAMVEEAEQLYGELKPIPDLSVNELQHRLQELNVNRDKTQADFDQVDADLKRVEEQVQELTISIQTKEGLLEDLICTDREMKTTNKQMAQKTRLLYEESSKTRRDLREAQRSLRLAENRSSSSSKVYKEKVVDCRKSLLELQQKIDANEQALKIVTASEDVDEARLAMEHMKSEQLALNLRLEQEQLRKRQLEEELEADRLKILSLETKVLAQEEQVKLSLKLSQDLEEQKVFLANEEQRLRAAEFETQMLQERLKEHLHKSPKSDSTVEKPSYLPFDEKRIRSEIEDLRGYKDDHLRSQRQFLEHKKEHSQPESQCLHCQLGGSESFTDRDEWTMNEIDVMTEVIDAAIDYKNQLLMGKAYLYDEVNDGHFLLQKLSALSPGEARHILHRFLDQVIDGRCEGRKRDVELDGLSDQLKEYYRIIQHQNHIINVKSLEYERKLDIQKREHLQKLSLLAKSQTSKSNPPSELIESYERKVKSLKEELKRTREHSQLYKRFYRENKHRFIQAEPVEPPVDRREASGGSEGSQASALDQERVEKFQRHAQKIIKKGQAENSKVIRDGRKLQIIVNDKLDT